MAAPALLGRGAELALLGQLLHRGERDGAALLLVGDPGIGKSALVRAAQQRARDAGWRVLRTTGATAEARLPYAGLHQLLYPLLPHLPALPARQRAVLVTAFGLADGAAPRPRSTALAAGRLLAIAAAATPVLLVADDTQWHDPQTHRALAILAGRIGPGVTFLAAARAGHDGPLLRAGLPELAVAGVDDRTARQLLLTCAADLEPAQRTLIQRLASGNPLALLELPAVWRGHRPPVTDACPFELPARLERALTAGIDDLPPGTRDAVLVAAVNPQHVLTEILAATRVLAGGPVDATVLDPAVGARLLTVEAGLVGFRHPLVPAGVLQIETVTRRMAANAALAAVLAAEPYRRTWHLARAIVGPDDRLAADLDTNVGIALHRGDVLAAIADLVRAAELSSWSTPRGHRLLLAAGQATGTGHDDLTDRLLRAAARCALTRLDAARLIWLRECLDEDVTADAPRIAELCRAAADALAGGGTELAGELLISAAMRCWWADPGPVVRAMVARLARQVPDTGADARRVAALAVVQPVRAARQTLARLDRPVTGNDADRLRLLGTAAHAVGDEVRAADLLERAATRLRADGRTGPLPQVLAVLLRVRTELGEWAGARAAAEEGRRLADATGRSLWHTGVEVCAARTEALRGRTGPALRLAAQAERAARGQGRNYLLACARLTRGCAWLSESRYDAAYTELRGLFDPEDPSFHLRERFAGVMYLAEAAARGGHRGDARAVIAGLEQESTPAPLLRVHLSYARAVLADDADAEDAYLGALRQDLRRWPWPRARLELAYGTWLRARRRPAFRPQLRSALAVFTTIGADTWASQARTQLSAADPDGRNPA